jgi:hypothetical protein
MQNDFHINRAAQLMAQIIRSERRKLKPTKEAAAEMLAKRQNIKQYELQFSRHVLEFFISFLLNKYSFLKSDPDCDHALQELKSLESSTLAQDKVRSWSIKNKIINIVQKYERQIKQKFPDYEPKF